MAQTSDSEFGNANYAVTADMVDGAYQLTWTGDPVAMSFASITANGTTQAYQEGAFFWNYDTDYVVRFFADTNNDKAFDARDETVGRAGTVAPDAVGDYYMVAMTHNAWTDWNRWAGNANALAQRAANKDGVIAVAFEVTPRSLEGVVAVNGDTGEGSFVYDGVAQNIQFSVNGKQLVFGQDYSVTVLNAAGIEIRIDRITDAGTYTATLTGEGGYTGTSATVEFTVSPLDLTTADIYVPDVQEGWWHQSITQANVLVNGVSLSDILAADVNEEQISYTDIYGTSHGKAGSGYAPWHWGYDTSWYVQKGGYTFQLTGKTANVTGTATYTINAVGTLVTDFRYGNIATATYRGIAGLPGAFDLSRGESYDGSLVVAYSGNAALTQGAGEGQITVTPQTAKTAGSYTAVARVNVPENYSIGGSVRQGFSVINGVLNPASADLVVAFYGVNFDVTAGAAYQTQYTGEAVVPAISVSCEGTALEAGTDYTVTFENAQGEAVESMVDAGTYTVEIALADGYTFGNGNDTVSFDVVIAPRELTGIQVVQDAVDANGNDGILYTGSAIEPAVQGTYTGIDGAERTIALDPSWYELHGLSMKSGEVYQPVDEVLEAGSYMVNVVPTGASANYTWDEGVYTVGFDVVRTSYFTDVASDAWYADEVALAATLGYVNGVGETKLFMPDNDISRAELSQVLFNMAGQSVREGVAFPTGFSDVPELAWFAQPVSWAAEAGVVTGMGDTGAFAPYDNATREQVATMLYRYAKAQGMDVSGAADLSAYADGEAVSWWAAEAVAWAVDAGVFGQGTDVLRPSDPISRAEVAAMAVRLQPENVTTA